MENFRVPFLISVTYSLDFSTTAESAVGGFLVVQDSDILSCNFVMVDIFVRAAITLVVVKESHILSVVCCLSSEARN